MNTLRRLWKKEYFQTVVTIVLIVAIVFGFWFGIQAGLGTSNPMLAVASGSMLPTLNVGDLIVVQGVNPADINAHYITGDIVVYRSLSRDELIVHRAVKIELRGDGYWITTRGDNNFADDSAWPSSALIGRVVGRIPYVGNLSLFTNARGNIFFFVIIIIIIVVIIVSMLPWDKHGTEEGQRERKLFGRIGLNIIYYLILNAILVGILIFSLWGSLSFWQPGAQPSQATIRGIYPDLQYHVSFSNVQTASLSQGFLTYKIDCIVDGTMRVGVPTLSWMQVSILVLAILDGWRFISYFIAKKNAAKPPSN